MSVLNSSIRGSNYYQEEKLCPSGMWITLLFAIKILTQGKEVVNRTGVNSVKVPAHHFHFDLEDEFPILTTKQVFIRQAVLEMLWIYQAQSNDVRWLQERDVKIWNEWEIDEEGYWNATQLLPDENGNLQKQKVHKFFG